VTFSIVLSAQKLADLNLVVNHCARLCMDMLSLESLCFINNV